MQQLSGLDAAFLALESATVFTHIGSVTVVDPSTCPEPLTLERLTEHVQSRLPEAPPFRRRLVDVPLGVDQPYWIEDPDFDIEYHVRGSAIPMPGTDDQLSDVVARLHARPLDRARPLWEMHLIEGLQGGRAAIYIKVHHAAIDGVSGNEIFTALLDASPQSRAPVHDDWEPEPVPSALQLLGRTTRSALAHPVRAARAGQALLRSLPALTPTRLVTQPRDVVLAGLSLRAPQLPFNKTITPHRRWAFGTLPLSEVKAVKTAHGGTVNDVVMSLVTGALRRWLEQQDALPDQPVVAAVPVSVRTTAGEYGNQVSALLCPLPTHLADPAARLQACREGMEAAKAQHASLPHEVVGDITTLAVPALSSQLARLATRARLMERATPFNLFVSNVPGPDMPFYFAGARVLGYYPMSAIVDGQGLNVTVMSLDGGLHFGLLADRDLVPDVAELCELLRIELDALLAMPSALPA
jgi:WS/DGAT/MGAT family acyltransferase